MLSRLTRLTLLAALAAVFANGALAATKEAPAVSYYTPAALHALAARSAGMQGEARYYATGSYYTPAALHALAARSAGMQGETRYYTAATNPTRGSDRTSVVAVAGAASLAAVFAGVLAVWMWRRRRGSVSGAVHSES